MTDQDEFELAIQTRLTKQKLDLFIEDTKQYHDNSAIWRQAYDKKIDLLLEKIDEMNCRCVAEIAGLAQIKTHMAEEKDMTKLKQQLTTQKILAIGGWVAALMNGILFFFINRWNKNGH